MVLAQSTRPWFAFAFCSQRLHRRALFGGGHAAPPGFGGATLHVAHVVADLFGSAHFVTSTMR